jgi:hypothetical protein
MTRIEIGTSVASGKAVMLDLQTLVATRLLIQANSGGGKSYTVRRIVEQADGKIQILIIDPEGEFSSLREKFAYVVAGKGGDVATEPRIAALLAQRLLDLRANAVLDLYEMRRMADRREFVKLFLDGLINSPKNLWHPVLVVIDESHVYCPEGKESESSDAVISLCQRGRKRGFCAVLATQRLASLSKDAAAQCGNVLIGPTTLDIDCKRAVQALGLSREKQAEMIRQMMRLDPGQFFCLGRAVSNEITLTKIGGVQTHHPEVAIAGKVALGPPPPPERVKAMLPKLGDLPKEADEEAGSVAALQRRVRELTHELAGAKRAPAARTADRAATEGAHTAEQVKRAVEAARRDYDRQFIAFTQRVNFDVRKMQTALRKVAEIASAATGIELPVAAATSPLPAHRDLPALRPAPLPAPRPAREKELTNLSNRQSDDADPESLGKGALKMLKVLAQGSPIRLSRSQLGTLAGYTASGGTFGNYFSQLRRAALIAEDAQGVFATEEGIERAGAVPPAPETHEEIVAMWRANLPAGPMKMLDILLKCWPDWLTREELGGSSGYTASGGTFGNYLSILRRNGLVEISGGDLRAAEALFP